MATLSPSKLDELALCAKSGLDNVDSGLGCYAVDPKNYDEFAMFFDKVCEDYHHGGGKIHTTNWSLDGVAGLPEDGQLDLQKIGLTEELSMRVRVGRNLTAFPLPGLMTKADRINFEKRMLLAFDALKANPAYGGSVAGVVQRLESVGLPCPALENPADHTMRLLQEQGAVSTLCEAQASGPSSGRRRNK